MNERLSVLKSAEISKSGHLTEGIKPIISCVGSFKDFGFKKPEKNGRNPSLKKISKNLKLENIRDLDWKNGIYEDGTEKSLTAGPATYIISPIDNSNKSSKEIFRCIVLIVAGVDKRTDKNISFLSHQDPYKFLFENKDKFTTHLEQRLKEMKEKCKPNTIDVVMVGGKYFSDEEIDNNYVTQFYDDSIELLGSEVKKILNFEPTIINGPKNGNNSDMVCYDNENRRLYFLRPKINNDTGSFSSSDIENQKHKWK